MACNKADKCVVEEANKLSLCPTIKNSKYPWKIPDGAEVQVGASLSKPKKTS